MYRVVFAFCCLGLGGCLSELSTPKQQAETSSQPIRVEAASRASAKQPKTRDTGGEPKKEDARSRKLSDARAQIRARDYGRQTPGPIPTSLPKSLRILIPAGIDIKVIGFEVHREMKWVRPSPKRLFLRLRLLTLERGAALRAAFFAGLAGAGWGPSGKDLVSPVQVPSLGTLSWKILEPEERPTTIDLHLEARIGQHQIPTIASLLRVKPDWWAAAAKTTVDGFEYSWFHGVHLGGVFSDIERVSVLYEPDDVLDLDRRLYAAVGQAGYRPDQDHPRKMRGPNRMSFFARVHTEPAALVVHHHRRWQRTHPDGKASP